ncbi:MAG: T9SS type A sorting domain-containing protein [Candidatus Cloacimonetes bacterium]|nr:T9SS type A sorting domain-containing protein [Candidatus Cloacimonadota bacterium]
MAFDGNYFYGSNAGTTIYQFDEDGNLYGTISSPVGVRAIAYDSDNDAFWVNNWNDDLNLIDRSGNVLNTISSPPCMYGCAYDNETGGGPYLWIFTGTSAGDGCQIEQYDLNTLSLTGIAHSVDGDFGIGSYISGGLFTYGDIIAQTWIIGGLAQGAPSLLFGYEFGPYNSWITINPSSGIIEPMTVEYITVNLYAYNDSVGTIHTCNIVFESPQFISTLIVPVNLTIIDTVSSNEIPHTETALHPNFPNPIMHTTTFNFSLKERSHVTLSVYNLKGQLVEILLDEELDPSASHTVEWDGTVKGRKLANGIYFYKLKTDNKSFLKKMILMR